MHPRITVDDGTLNTGNMMQYQLHVFTDADPDGMQRHIEFGPHEFNTGAIFAPVSLATAANRGRAVVTLDN